MMNLSEVFQLKLTFDDVVSKGEFITELKASYLNDDPFFLIKKISSQSVILVFDSFGGIHEIELFLDFLKQFYFKSLEVNDELGEFVLLNDIEELAEDNDGLNPVLSALVLWYVSQF